MSTTNANPDVARDPRLLVFWGLFALGVGSAWLLLLGMALSASPFWVATTSGISILDFLRWAGDVCRAGASSQNLSVLFAMWLLMALAMMGPTAIPFLQCYANLGRAGGKRPPQGGQAALFAGYILVWGAFALVAGGGQALLYQQGLVDREGVASSLWIAVALLAIAGGFQLSTWKLACLNRCRDPFRFFLVYWRDGVGGAFAMGVRQGLICAACCWALMLLAFVGGVMNVLWMAAATVLMVLEKWPGSPDRLRKLVAGVLLIASAGIAVRAVMMM